ncbi:hypothetical protein [Micropruina sp.]
MADTSRICLTSISSRAWEHPADRGALIEMILPQAPSNTLTAG